MVTHAHTQRGIMLALEGYEYPRLWPSLEGYEFPCLWPSLEGYEFPCLWPSLEGYEFPCLWSGLDTSLSSVLVKGEFRGVTAS